VRVARRAIGGIVNKREAEAEADETQTTEAYAEIGPALRARARACAPSN